MHTWINRGSRVTAALRAAESIESRLSFLVSIILIKRADASGPLPPPTVIVRVNVKYRRRRPVKFGWEIAEIASPRFFVFVANNKDGGRRFLRNWANETIGLDYDRSGLDFSPLFSPSPSVFYIRELRGRGRWWINPVPALLSRVWRMNTLFKAECEGLEEGSRLSRFFDFDRWILKRNGKFERLIRIWWSNRLDVDWNLVMGEE